MITIGSGVESPKAFRRFHPKRLHYVVSRYISSGEQFQSKRY